MQAKEIYSEIVVKANEVYNYIQNICDDCEKENCENCQYRKVSKVYMSETIMFDFSDNATDVFLDVKENELHFSQFRTINEELCCVSFKIDTKENSITVKKEGYPFEPVNGFGYKILKPILNKF